MTFRGGFPPQYNKRLYDKYSKMVKDNPKKLRTRVKADIAYMKSHKFCNNRAINYNLYRGYSLSITDLKDLFAATGLGDLVSICIAQHPEEWVFGSPEAQQRYMQETDDDAPFEEEEPESDGYAYQNRDTAQSERGDPPSINRPQNQRQDQTMATTQQEPPPVQAAEDALTHQDEHTTQDEQARLKQIRDVIEQIFRTHTQQTQTLRGAVGEKAYSPQQEVHKELTAMPSHAIQPQDFPQVSNPNGVLRRRPEKPFCPMEHISVDLTARKTNKNFTQQEEMDNSHSVHRSETTKTTPLQTPPTYFPHPTNNESTSKPEEMITHNPFCMEPLASEIRFSEIRDPTKLPRSPKLPLPSPTKEPIHQRNDKQSRTTTDLDVPTVKTSTITNQSNETDPDTQAFSASTPMTSTGQTVTAHMEQQPPQIQTPSSSQCPTTTIPQTQERTETPTAHDTEAQSRGPNEAAHSVSAPVAAPQDTITDVFSKWKRQKQHKVSHPETASTTKKNLNEITEELKKLSQDNEQVVFRNPSRFGDVQYNYSSRTIEIQLYKVPTELTREEKKFIIQCERDGRTLRAKYHDINLKDMIRCPLSSCRYTIINNKNIGQSLGIHFREKHTASNTACVITYTNRGKVHRIHHPDSLNTEQATKEGWMTPRSLTDLQISQQRPEDEETMTQRNSFERPTEIMITRGQGAPRKPTKTIDRYRQLTITEMMLKVRNQTESQLSTNQNEGDLATLTHQGKEENETATEFAPQRQNLRTASDSNTPTGEPECLSESHKYPRGPNEQPDPVKVPQNLERQGTKLAPPTTHPAVFEQEVLNISPRERMAQGA